MLVDSHCHLNFPQFEGQIEQIIQRAADNDVKLMQTICTTMAEFPDILAIANKFDNVYASIGVHPNNVEKEPIVTLEQLVEGAKNQKVIGIGETGLDYYYEHSPRDMQKTSLLVHIQAARDTGLPIIIHTRDADDDTIDILTSEYKKGEFKGLIHCFSTAEKLARAAIDIGFYISIPGIITFKKATQLQEIVKRLPLDRLLVETDSPYLAPVPYRGKTNEPAYTRHTAEFLAQLKNISYEEVAKATTENFYSLFSHKTIRQDSS
ncbi:TatD family hydrolase [Rickettsiales bacterium]|nr:TatD family hydrolase [Rickettsiales bacterium]